MPVIDCVKIKLSMNRFAVVDLETTDTEEDSGIVEFGYKLAKFQMGGEPTVEKAVSILANPMKPIRPEASSAHNLRDEDVADKPPYLELMKEFMDQINNRIWIIHNPDFDYKIIKANTDKLGITCSPRYVIDTLRFARKLLKDKIKSRTLGTLFHYYKIERSAQPTHRADDDCEATFLVFLHLCNDYFRINPTHTLRDMISYIYSPFEIDSLGFGKHKDVPLSQIPQDYLNWWIFKRGKQEDEKHDINYAIVSELIKRLKNDSRSSSLVISSAIKRLEEIASLEHKELNNFAYPISYSV